MLLHHFTSRDHLRSIKATGLTRGVVHLSRTRQLSAIWLTTDPGPSGHGLEAGGAFMSDDDRREARDWTGAMPPPGARFPKLAEVRITVELDAADRNLHEWLPWARRHVEPEWMAQLHPVASFNLKKAKNWRIYTGIILPEAIVDTRELEASAAPAGVRPRLPLG